MKNEETKDLGDTKRFEVDGEYYYLGEIARHAHGLFVNIVNGDLDPDVARQKIEGIEDDNPLHARFGRVAIDNAEGQEGDGLMADKTDFIDEIDSLQREIWPEHFDNTTDAGNDDDTCRHGVPFSDDCEECAADFE